MYVVCLGSGWVCRIISVHDYYLLNTLRRKERQLQEIMNKVKRHSVSGHLPVSLEPSLFEAQSYSDTTDDEVDGHPHNHTSPIRYSAGPKMERATSFDVSTPRGRPKRPWRRKRKCSNNKEESGPATLDPDMMNSKQTLLPQSPSDSPSHSPSLVHQPFPRQQSTPPRELNHMHSSKEFAVSRPTSGESTPRLVLESMELPITEEGDLSPAVAQFLESVKRPIHVRRSTSNTSLRTHRRQGSNGSTHSYNVVVPSPLSGSPVKGLPQGNSNSSLSRSRRAPPPIEHTSSRRGSGAGVHYTKLDSSSSGEEDREHETGTQSSDHNTTTTNDGQSLFSRFKPAGTQPNETQSAFQRRSPGRELYSNDSSGETRCSDGGHDADGESDGNSLDLLSELEPNETNESNLESLHSPSNLEESSDITSTTPDVLDSDVASTTLAPKLKQSTLHSSRNNVAMLITQFEVTSSDNVTELGNRNDHQQPEQPDIPVHIRRDVAVPLAGSYSPKAVEDLLEGGWLDIRM